MMIGWKRFGQGVIDRLARGQTQAVFGVEHEIKKNPDRIHRDLAGQSRNRKFEFISLQR